MRRVPADYRAIEHALESYQLRTIHDYTDGMGLPADRWNEDAVCSAFALRLAIANRLRRLLEEGASINQAIARTAAEFDIDYETLKRQRRRVRQRVRSSNAKNANRPDEPSG